MRAAAKTALDYCKYANSDITVKIIFSNEHVTFLAKKKYSLSIVYSLVENFSWIGNLKILRVRGKQSYWINIVTKTF